MQPSNEPEPETIDRSLERDSRVAHQLIVSYKEDYRMAITVLFAGRLIVGLVGFYFIWRSDAFLFSAVTSEAWSVVLCVYVGSLTVELWSARRQLLYFLQGRSTSLDSKYEP